MIVTENRPDDDEIARPAEGQAASAARAQRHRRPGRSDPRGPPFGSQIALRRGALSAVSAPAQPRAPVDGSVLFAGGLADPTPSAEQNAAITAADTVPAT